MGLMSARLPVRNGAYRKRVAVLCAEDRIPGALLIGAFVGYPG